MTIETWELLGIIGISMQIVGFFILLIRSRLPETFMRQYHETRVPLTKIQFDSPEAIGILLIVIGLLLTIFQIVFD